MATVLAFAQLTRLTVFMVAPSRANFAQFPSSKFEVRHSCVSAYYVAAQAANVSTNVYDPALYNAPDDDPTRMRKPKTLGPFNVDVYEYPPPFLAVPRSLQLVAPEFLRFRTLWFGLNGLVLLAACVLVARSLGPAAGTRALLLSPLVMGAIPTVSFLEKGNVQGAMIAMAMIAMVAFERRRWALGGALLAYATVSKLFPGMIEPIAASYNGGEDNVARWLKRSKRQDPGVFTSEVGFDETKGYVQKVMANYRVYRKLYTADLIRR